MNRQQRRMFAKTQNKMSAQAQQEKALMQHARMGHILMLQGQIEELRQYLKRRFPDDWVTKTEGGVILAGGGGADPPRGS